MLNLSSVMSMCCDLNNIKSIRNQLLDTKMTQKEEKKILSEASGTVKFSVALNK